jgi:hypothetical protein
MQYQPPGCFWTVLRWAHAVWSSWSVCVTPSTNQDHESGQWLRDALQTGRELSFQPFGIAISHIIQRVIHPMLTTNPLCPFSKVGLPIALNMHWETRISTNYNMKLTIFQRHQKKPLGVSQSLDNEDFWAVYQSDCPSSPQVLAPSNTWGSLGHQGLVTAM